MLCCLGESYLLPVLQVIQGFVVKKVVFFAHDMLRVL